MRTRRGRTFISGGLASSSVHASRVAIVLIAVTLLIAAPAGPGVAAATGTSVSRPDWTPGDFWTYRSNTTIATGFNLTGELTSTMEGTQPIVVGGITIQADRVVMGGAGTATGSVTTGNGTVAVNGQWILTGEELLEPTNLQIVYSLADLSVNGTYAFGVPFDLRVQNTTTFDIVSSGWAYPLTAGNRGDVTVDYNFTQDIHGSTVADSHTTGMGHWTLGFAMDAPVSVATPVGTFLGFPMTETWPDGSSERTYYAVDVGNSVRTESYGTDGSLVAVSTLTTYRYQAAEPATILGLTVLQWAFVLPVTAVAVVVAAWAWRRSRRRKRNPAAPELTSGPRDP